MGLTLASLKCRRCCRSGAGVSKIQHQVLQGLETCKVDPTVAMGRISGHWGEQCCWNIKQTRRDESSSPRQPCTLPQCPHGLRPAMRKCGFRVPAAAAQAEETAFWWWGHGGSDMCRRSQRWWTRRTPLRLSQTINFYWHIVALGASLVVQW